MDFNLSEKEIIYILNCMSITLNFMKWHTYEEKERIKMYFNNENYFENYYDIELMYRTMSCSANKHFYNIRDSVFFKGQEDFMTYKNFEFLKDKERYNNNLIKLNPRKEQVFESRKNIFFTKFKKFIDKNKNVV